MQLFIIAVGLGLAGWGHLLVHDLFGARASWRTLDDQFPPVMRSSAGFAGAALLVIGGLLVLAPVLR